MIFIYLFFIIMKKMVGCGSWNLHETDIFLFYFLSIFSLLGIFLANLSLLVLSSYLI
jgi:hypothetical protein